MKKELKLQLYKHCLDYVKNHIEINGRAVSSAQEAVDDETESSGSDKSDTSRAMKELETETFGRRLEEVLAQHQLLQKIEISKDYDVVMSGSLVYTSIGNFFIAISADEVIIDGEEYCVVSPESPIGQAMANRTSGSSVSFRGKTVKILDIC